MQEESQPLQTLEDIKQLMHRSSRFISLSGWSGVAAGSCALVAAFITADRIACAKSGDCLSSPLLAAQDVYIKTTLLTIAIITFIVAAALAFFFTYLHSRKTGV